jgi:Uma2 family endonuclease
MATVEQQVPLLVHGQMLTRDEFLRRWEAMPDLKRAELIKGVVRMPSPVSTDHGDQDFDIGGWLWYYATQTPGTQGNKASTILMLGDAPQPDSHLRIVGKAGGRSKRKGKYLEGALELIAEVSRSSADYDLDDKLELYQKAGVLEYLVILVQEQEIRWFYRLGKTLRLMPAPADGVWKSRVFPGLWLEGSALLGGNTPKVLATLQEGLQSSEHAAFAAKLAARLKS